MSDKERDEPSCDGAEIAEGPDSVRRGLLKMAGAVAALTLAPGVTVFARDLVLKGQHKGKGPVRYGLLIDARACKTGCNACVRACQDYNGLSHDPGPDNAQWIRKVTVTERNLRQYRELFNKFQESVQQYCNTYGIGFTRTSTEIAFDELILRMMRVAGAVR